MHEPEENVAQKFVATWASYAVLCLPALAMGQAAAVVFRCGRLMARLNDLKVARASARSVVQRRGSALAPRSMPTRRL